MYCRCRILTCLIAFLLAKHVLIYVNMNVLCYQKTRNWNRGWRLGLHTDGNRIDGRTVRAGPVPSVV